jgi:hypothetical protein
LPAILDLVDIETPEERLSLNLRQQNYLDAISENIQERRENLENIFATYKIDHLKLATVENFVDTLVRFFSMRQQKALRS